MLAYRTKVRTRTFVWGGQGITAVLKSPLILTVRVPEEGETIELGTRKASSAREGELGTLAPGECFSIPLDDISGVFATCKSDTQVDCFVHTATDNSRLNKE